MKSIILIALIWGEVTVTAYRSVPNQTDNSPFFTSIGESVRPGGVAISRDLLCGACRRLHKRCKHPDYPKRLHYGDWLYVKEIGFMQVNDVMGAYSVEYIHGKKVRIPLRQRIDVWVPTLAGEKEFHHKFKDHKVMMWKITIEEK